MRNCIFYLQKYKISSFYFIIFFGIFLLYKTNGFWDKKPDMLYITFNKSF